MSAEGVPVAWLVWNVSRNEPAAWCAFRDERSARKEADRSTDESPCSFYYEPRPLFAHPAAASAESIRAEVIEECARVCEKYATVSRVAAEAAIGKSVIVCLRDHEAASTECAAMIRALSRANKEVS